MFRSPPELKPEDTVSLIPLADFGNFSLEIRSRCQHICGPFALHSRIASALGDLIYVVARPHIRLGDLITIVVRPHIRDIGTLLSCEKGGFVFCSPRFRLIVLEIAIGLNAMM